jgi:hypothetical protein
MIMHAFIVPGSDGSIIVESDFNAKSTVVTAHNAGKKILVSI